jgi:hypothetical protein
LEEGMERVIDEMVCVCGETLRGKLDENGSTVKGSLAEEYEQHLRREDHRISPAQWATAYEKIAEGRERMKKQGWCLQVADRFTIRRPAMFTDAVFAWRQGRNSDG